MKEEVDIYSNNKIFQTQFVAGRLHEVNFPKTILIDTVSYCNLRCSMCGHKEMTRTKSFMEWDLFTKIIDEISDIDKNVRVWLVFFGEPFILKRKKPTIFEMISYAKNKGLTDVVLNSNGNLLDSDSAKKLIASELDAVYFGVDAYSAETYSKLRVGGNYEKVVNNIIGLLNLKKIINAEKPKIFVQFVEMDSNKDEKDDFVQFWNSKGATVKIRPKVSWSDMIDAPNLVLNNEERWPCHWAMQSMSIINTGEVVTCAVDLDAKFVAGNLRTQSLRDIWNSKLKDLRKIHETRDFDSLPDNCRNCRDWQAARSECY